MPWIEYKGERIQESAFLLQWLKKKMDSDLDAELTAEQQAIAGAFQHQVECHLLPLALWFQWCDHPNSIQPALHVPWLFQARTRRTLQKSIHIRLQAMGLGTRLAVWEAAKEDVDRLCCFLGTKQFMMGTKGPTTVDTVVFGCLVHLLYFDVDRTELGEYVAQKLNLVRYTDLILQRYFPDQYMHLLSRHRPPVHENKFA